MIHEILISYIIGYKKNEKILIYKGKRKIRDEIFPILN